MTDRGQNPEDFMAVYIRLLIFLIKELIRLIL